MRFQGSGDLPAHTAAQALLFVGSGLVPKLVLVILPPALRMVMKGDLLTVTFLSVPEPHHLSVPDIPGLVPASISPSPTLSFSPCGSGEGWG